MAWEHFLPDEPAPRQEHKSRLLLSRGGLAPMRHNQNRENHIGICVMSMGDVQKSNVRKWRKAMTTDWARRETAGRLH